ncbi:MAG: GatB/YqeY domain-containing protein [Candidatus Moranbacteria bacterium]|nr:GatB/YqeY domain-containing protein [Candidatus Moranbacteria bacterium]
MSLYNKVVSDIRTAMKSGDTQRRDTLRLFDSAVKNECIDKKISASEVSDDVVESVARRLVKQRRDSISQYGSAGRDDLVSVEQAELDVLLSYLPVELDEAGVRLLVEELIASFDGELHHGKLIGAVMQRAAGRADGALVKRVVEEMLST